MKIFTECLRSRAADLGISNAGAARRCGLGERRYANYAAGARETDLATLAKIAKALETTPDHLLGFGESKAKGARARLLDRVASASAMLPDDRLETVVIQVEALAAKQKRPPSAGL